MTVDFAEIYEQYQGRIFGYIYRRVDDTDQAADLTADVFFKAIRATNHGIGAQQADPLSWLYQIAQNSIIDFYRHRDHYQFVSIDDCKATLFDEDTELQFERCHLRECIDSATRRATEDQRQVIQFQLRGYSHAEIAMEMGKTEGTVKMLKFRAFNLIASDLHEFTAKDARPNRENLREATQKVCAQLKNHGPMTVVELSIAANLRRTTVLGVVNNHPDQFVKVGEQNARHNRGTAYIWGLRQ